MLVQFFFFNWSKEFLIHCSYIVPEYSFLDARGLGSYEGKKLESVSDVRYVSIHLSATKMSLFFVIFI